MEVKIMLREILGVFNGENQRRHDRHVGVGVVLGTLTGLAIGAVVGILFAPQSGKETRDDIAKASEKGFIKTKETLGKAGEKISEVTSNTVSTVADTYSEFKDTVEDVKDQRKAARIARRNQRLTEEAVPVAGGATTVIVED